MVQSLFFQSQSDFLVLAEDVLDLELPHRLKHLVVVLVFQGFEQDLHQLKHFLHFIGHVVVCELALKDLSFGLESDGERLLFEFQVDLAVFVLLVMLLNDFHNCM